MGDEGAWLAMYCIVIAVRGTGGAAFVRGRSLGTRTAAVERVLSQALI